MNYKKVKNGIKPKAQKIKDSVVSFSELLEKNVPAMDIVNELDQYLSSDVKKDFIEHYKVLYDITDATIVESPVFTETMIEAQKDKIDQFKYNMKDMLKEGSSPSYIIGAFDHYLNDYYTKRVVEELKDKLNLEGNFRSIYGVAIAADDFAKVVETLDDVEAIPDIIREQVVTDTLYHEQYMNDFIEDSVDLNERAALVEKYTEDLNKIVEDGKMSAIEVLDVVDKICEDKIEDISKKISEELDKPESLDKTIVEYINHTEIDPVEALKVVTTYLPEEDRLVIVDSILED